MMLLRAFAGWWARSLLLRLAMIIVFPLFALLVVLPVEIWRPSWAATFPHFSASPATRRCALSSRLFALVALALEMQSVLDCVFGGSEWIAILSAEKIQTETLPGLEVPCPRTATNPALVGQLEEVPLRVAWPHETQMFTPWLAANIDKLAAAIGIPLVVLGAEGSSRRPRGRSLGAELRDGTSC